MSKRFDIHDWQAKQKQNLLIEHTVKFTKDDMATLHNDGKLVKADDDGKDHTYIFKGDLSEQPDDLERLGSTMAKGFDDRLAQQMGMSNDEFEDQVASRDIGDDSFGSAGTDKRTQQVITDIIQQIKSINIDPMEVMEVISEEFKIKGCVGEFEFSGGAPGFKQADTPLKAAAFGLPAEPGSRTPLDPNLYYKGMGNQGQLGNVTNKK